MILILVDMPAGFDERIRRLRPEARLVHREDEPESLEEAEIILGWPNVETIPRARRLRWIQLPSAGADRYVGRLPDDVVLTNASGVYGIPVAEHVFSMMLGLVRALPHSVRAAQRSQWDRDGSYDELYGRTCGVLGLGDIGMEVSRRAAAFGMRVIAFKRQASVPPEFVDEVYGHERLGKFLAECHHVVNTLPETPQTVHLLDERAFKAVREGAYFYNVGRGKTVDETALVEALRSGRLAGCGLDVFEEEPLSPESPLWSLPNVIITPHVAGASPRESDRLADLFMENLTRWVADRPLLNVVDQEAGY